MTTVQLQELARVGAEARLRAIGEERQALLQAFPDLGERDLDLPSRTSATARSSAPAPAGRKRSGMSPAQRKAVGERMKAYWAKRRGEKAGTQTESLARAESAPAAASTATKQSSKPKPMSPGRKAQAEKMRAYWAARRAEKVNSAGKGLSRRLLAGTARLRTNVVATQGGSRNERSRVRRSEAPIGIIHSWSSTMHLKTRPKLQELPLVFTTIDARAPSSRAP